jgi:hypothetical protein
MINLYDGRPQATPHSLIALPGPGIDTNGRVSKCHPDDLAAFPSFAKSNKCSALARSQIVFFSAPSI